MIISTVRCSILHPTRRSNPIQPTYITTVLHPSLTCYLKPGHHKNTVTKWKRFMLWPSWIILASNSNYLLERVLIAVEKVKKAVFWSEQCKSQGFGTLFRWRFHCANQELDFAFALKSCTDIQSLSFRVWANGGQRVIELCCHAEVSA